MNVPIIEVIENMSYFTLPDSGKRIAILGKSKGRELAKLAEASFLAQIPIDPKLAELRDNSNIEHYSSDIFDTLSQDFAQALQIRVR
jgi:hypothetical protein